MKTQEVWTLFADDIRYFILSKVKDEIIAEDLLQDTFIKIHTKFHQLKTQDKLKSWVFSIARFTVIDYFRQRHLTYSLQEHSLVVEEAPEVHSEHDCLLGIINNLPEK